MGMKIMMMGINLMKMMMGIIVMMKVIMKMIKRNRMNMFFRIFKMMIILLSMRFRTIRRRRKFRMEVIKKWIWESMKIISMITRMNIKIRITNKKASCSNPSWTVSQK